jgi:hypothetical protein
MVPPRRAEEGMFCGMGMPTCFAEEMALEVEISSLGVISSCQSSSAAMDSERTELETREDSLEWVVEPEWAKRSPSRSPSSSQLSTAGMATNSTVDGARPTNTKEHGDSECERVQVSREIGKA